MRLIQRIEREGMFLFRWRSFLPLFITPVALLALYDGAAAGESWGPVSDDIWAYCCMAVSFAGLAVRWMTVGYVPGGTSGRSTRFQRADMLNTTGMYAIVRNPLYLGNFIAILGLALSTGVWWFVLLVCAVYWLYIERIIANEERFLAHRFSAVYGEWARDTPAFLPRFRCWRRPAQAFSMRTVLRREYSGVLAVAAAYFSMEAVSDLFLEREAPELWLDGDRVWIWLLFASLASFLTLRTMKKHTRLLRVSSR